MQTYIAILRGINVSGQKSIKMDEFRAHLASLGFKNLTTYIQSGNIIFQSEINQNIVLEDVIGVKIKEIYGFEVPVIVRSQKEWQQVVDAFPFNAGLELIRLLVTFLQTVPTHIPFKEIEALKAKDDEVFISGKEVYLYVPNGYGKSKLINTTLERKLQVSATTRNWNTILKLLALSKNLS